LRAFRFSEKYRFAGVLREYQGRPKSILRIVDWDSDAAIGASPQPRMMLEFETLQLPGSLNLTALLVQGDENL
jgi:hypothetical protein